MCTFVVMHYSKHFTYDNGYVTKDVWWYLDSRAQFVSKNFFKNRIKFYYKKKLKWFNWLLPLFTVSNNTLFSVKKNKI